MTFSINNLAIALALLISPLAQAATPVLQTKNGITMTAQVVSPEDSLATFGDFRQDGSVFGKDLVYDHIFPIHVSIQNNSEKAIVFSNDWIKIPNAMVLTPKSLEGEINTMAYGALIFFPLAYQYGKLTDLRPIIKKHSSGDKLIVIKPGATFATYVFANVENPEDAQGNLLPFVTPAQLNTKIELRSNGWLNAMRNKTAFTLHVPIAA